MNQEQLLIALLVGLALGILSGGYHQAPAGDPSQMEEQALIQQVSS